MLRVYIWNPMGSVIDPMAWGDMVADNADLIVQGARSVAEFVTGADLRPAGGASSRILPDIYDETVGWRYGHAGMGFRNVVVGGTPIVAYRALWPRDETNWPLLDPEPGLIKTSLDEDRASEHGPPDIIFNVPARWPIDEAAVWAQWELWRATPPGYAAYGFNCCAAVARSLRNNIDVAGLTPLAQAVVNAEPFSPYALRQWLVNLRVSI